VETLETVTRRLMAIHLRRRGGCARLVLDTCAAPSTRDYTACFRRRVEEPDRIFCVVGAEGAWRRRSRSVPHGIRTVSRQMHVDQGPARFRSGIGGLLQGVRDVFIRRKMKRVLSLVRGFSLSLRWLSAFGCERAREPTLGRGIAAYVNEQRKGECLCPKCDSRTRFVFMTACRLEH